MKRAIITLAICFGLCVVFSGGIHTLSDETSPAEEASPVETASAAPLPPPHTAPFGTASEPAAADETGQREYGRISIQGGTILHCFNWSYQAITDNLPAIARAGYAAVQTSPVQPPKDYSASCTGTESEWWKLYQPLDLAIAGDNQSWLGTKQDLKGLCQAAEQYGISVIVDIVANHMANNGTDGGTFASLSPDVAEDMRSEEYYHNDSEHTTDNSRYDMTWRHLNMPDLNTGSAYVQKKVLALLCECVDCGVDGFRFDAAKHIELEPEADGDCGSYFWRNVLGGATEYAKTRYNKTDLFFYGEILNHAGTDVIIAVLLAADAATAKHGWINAHAPVRFHSWRGYIVAWAFISAVLQRKQASSAIFASKPVYYV